VRQSDSVTVADGGFIGLDVAGVAYDKRGGGSCECLRLPCEDDELGVGGEDNCTDLGGEPGVGGHGSAGVAPVVGGE
jgi:hypothetical protein